MRAPWRDALMLAGFVAACFAAAGLGSLFTTPAVRSWYPAIAKPPWGPPDWVFGPVWTALYAMMAVAGWLVWRARGFAGAPWALGLFGAQLVLNAAWSPLFFGLRAFGAAFAEIVVLWLAIAATMVCFFRAVPAAGWLLVPYLAWVGFASALNFAIWRLNA
ncbi:MAG: TspO/MBR family protein [Candidatus Brocadiia bacterium]